jgi:hypothetical protein
MSTNISPRELPHERAQRQLMITTAQAEYSEGDRDPVWCSKAFYGSFGDNHLMDTTLEGGQTYESIPEMIEVANEVIGKYQNKPELSLFSKKDIQTFKKVLNKLSDACKVYWGPVKSSAFVKYLEDRSNEVKDLKVNDFLLWCGGWCGTGGGHAIMYMVHKTSKKEVSFVVLNTGQGVGYHPGTASDKTKRHTQYRLNNIPIENITNTSWLYFLFRIKAFGHKDHDEKVFYEVILPTLIEKPLCEGTYQSGTDPYLIPETLQRSGVCYYRCILTATRYSMRLLGLNQNQVKQMLHVIRRGYIHRVIHDLKRSHDSVKDNNPNDV